MKPKKGQTLTPEQKNERAIAKQMNQNIKVTNYKKTLSAEEQKDFDKLGFDEQLKIVKKISKVSKYESGSGSTARIIDSFTEFSKLVKKNAHEISDPELEKIKKNMSDLSENLDLIIASNLSKKVKILELQKKKEEIQKEIDALKK